jgi:hypothetical protein
MSMAGGVSNYVVENPMSTFVENMRTSRPEVGRE